jgi:hypothetical protein
LRRSEQTGVKVGKDRLCRLPGHARLDCRIVEQTKKEIVDRGQGVALGSRIEQRIRIRQVPVEPENRQDRPVEAACRCRGVAIALQHGEPAPDRSTFGDEPAAAADRPADGQQRVVDCGVAGHDVIEKIAEHGVPVAGEIVAHQKHEVHHLAAAVGHHAELDAGRLGDQRDPLQRGLDLLLAVGGNPGCHDRHDPDRARPSVEPCRLIVALGRERRLEKERLHAGNVPDAGIRRLVGQERDLGLRGPGLGGRTTAARQGQQDRHHQPAVPIAAGHPTSEFLDHRLLPMFISD